MRLINRTLTLAALAAATLTPSLGAQVTTQGGRGGGAGAGRGGQANAGAIPQLTQEERLIAIAKRIHEKVMTLDTHVDINPSNFRVDSVGKNYGARLVSTQVDLVKMEEGGLDAAFLIAYVGQRENTPEGFARANAEALEKFAAVRKLVDSIAPTRVGLALTPEDARRIYAAGKKVVFIGIENGFSIGNDVTNVQKFYDLGGRYMSLAHNNHSQLSDSNTGERDDIWLWNGISPMGREVLKEMNRVGMMIDISHPSKISMMQSLQISKAPIIASHSGVRALCNHSRNLDDEQLRGLKKNGGVVQLVAFSGYVKCNPGRDSLRASALADLQKEFGINPGPQAQITTQLQALPTERQNAYLARRQEITDRRYPSEERATVEDFVRHIDYVVQLIGIDHVGISSDFDGGGGVVGWNNASESFNVTLALVKHGYSDEDIEKIWSGNLLRVMGKVQDVAKQIQAGAIKTQ